MKKVLAIVFLSILSMNIFTNVASACYEEQLNGVYHEVVEVIEVKDGYTVVKDVLTGDVFGYTNDMIFSDIKEGDVFWAWSIYEEGELINFHMELLDTKEKLDNATFWYNDNHGIFEEF